MYPTRSWLPAAVFFTAAASAAHARQVLQGVVDLTEFDAPAAELDLIVRAALEHQAGGLEPDQVAASVGAFPPERGHRRVLLGVLRGIEVTGEADAADHQLAYLTDRDGIALGVDDGKVPAVEGEADADGALAVHQCAAGDDGCLGGAVSVPDLAALDGQALGQFGWAGFAAEDQESNGFEGLGRPQRRKRRHSGDDADVTRDQPRAEVHAAANQRTRSRDEAGAVAPREPHLLAGRVECHGESREDAVTRPDGLVLEEHARLGVDEGCGIEVSDRDALGGARGS